MSASATSDIQAISVSGRLLGSLFYMAPDHQQLIPLLTEINQPDWANQWPCGQLSQITPSTNLMTLGLHQTEGETLKQAFQRLFIGPNNLPAPPWGSVYLDRESVIFGDSTLALKSWLRTIGVTTQSTYREPEDHIGLLLMLAAWLAESNPDQIAILLSDHLLPWSGRFLQLLIESAQHPFYLGLAQLTELTLADWQHRLALQIVHQPLFR